MPKKRDLSLLKKIGTRFQRIRLEKGWTQEELAGEIDVEPITISRFEMGKRGLSLYVLFRAAEKMDIGLGELLDVHSKRQKPRKSSEETRLDRSWDKLTTKQKDLALRVLSEIAK